MRNALAALTSTAFPTDRVEFFAAHVRPDGRAWSFEGHEYLRAIVADDSRDVVVRKAAQLGVSTVAIGRMLYDCAHGRKVGYYLPDRDFMRAFVQDRVDPIINADDPLARATTEGKALDAGPTNARLRRKSADNLRIKHIAQGSAWFQGLQNLKDAKSIDLDALVLDEVTELDPRFLLWLDDRLLHSEYKRRFALSQAGVPDFGIDAEFQASDQKFYMIRCRRCRRWANLIEDWPDCLVSVSPRRSTVPVDAVPEHRIVCKKCGGRIRTHDGGAEWVAKHPGRPVSGYALSQLYGPHCDASEVARRLAKAERSRDAMESLMISVVGVPYAGDRQPLNDDVLSKACRDWGIGPPTVLDAAIPAFQRERPFRLAGIDTGDVLHAVIGQADANGVLHIFDVRAFSGGDNWEQLTAWLRAAGATFFCIDALPYTTNAKNLCRSEGLDGAIVYFNALSLTLDLAEKASKRPIKVCKHDRTEAIDDMADAMIGREILLPRARLDIMTTVKAHCLNLVKDLGPDGKYHYKRAVENHFGLALTYANLARRVCESLRIGPAEPFGDPASHLVGKRASEAVW